MTPVKPGDRVQVHFTGRLADGSVFGSSVGGPALRFAAGAPDIVPGISQSVIGMCLGEKKTVTVLPDQGFGQLDPNLQRRVPRATLPPEAKLGDQLTARVGDRQSVVWLIAVEEDTAVIDGNHPLAGQTLTFDLELVSIDA